LKYVLKSIYYKYKESKSVKQFFFIFILAFMSALVYVFYFTVAFFFIFIIVFLHSLVAQIVYKKPYEMRQTLFYNCEFKNDLLWLVKYYAYNIIVQYSFSILYIIVNIIKDSSRGNLVKTLVTRFFNFLFIYLFGFLVVILRISRKLYTRVNNSVNNGRLSFILLECNLTSMYFFDFVDRLEIENLKIMYFNNY